MTSEAHKRRHAPRTARVLGILMVGMLALAGCVGQNSNNGGNEGGSKSGSHTLVIARNMDLIDTDPSTAICDTCQIVFAATYQTLVTLADDNHTLIPEVAKSWTANSDHTVWTFKLNPQAKFSDGTPLTSADVKFSLLRLKNLAGSASYLVNVVKGVTTPDPHTVVVTLTTPDWEFPNQMSATYTSVINSKEVKANGGTDAADAPKTDKADHWFQSHSAGSGPYELQSFTSGQQVTLVANPNYWGPKPFFTRVVFKQTETAASQAQLLQSGEADIAMQLNPVTASSLQGQSGITVKTIPSFNVLWIGMSSEVKNKYVQGPMTLKVRKAILAAIDYQQLESVLMKGDSKLQATPIPNGFPGSEGLPLPKTNVALAKKLLKEAGYPNGYKATLSYPEINAYGVDLGVLAQLLQTQLKKANIDLSLNPATFAVNTTGWGGHKLPFELLYWAPDYYGSMIQFVGFFGLVKGGTMGALSAATASSPPVVDPIEQKYFDKAMGANSQAEATHFLNLAGQQMVANPVAMPLFSPNIVMGYQNGIKGVGYSGCCNLKLWNLSR
ncbi:MAG: ABC transporter substrate-binding protein [Nocardiopsaceae bacterium]|jgi:peptide/nickel transport system substrate-binding protein|nr:ABC transporter substrate-binding protein [Nocardiopsaceae bacterium]